MEKVFKGGNLKAYNSDKGGGIYTDWCWGKSWPNQAATSIDFKQKTDSYKNAHTETSNMESYKMLYPKAVENHLLLHPKAVENLCNTAMKVDYTQKVTVFTVENGLKFSHVT